MAGTVHRFYVEESLEVGATVDLPADRARQIGSVLRLRAGDPVVVFNGDGAEFLATLATVTKSRVTASLDAVQAGPPMARPPIQLAQALLKTDRFDWVVQKTTELGVTRIIPMSTDRTVVTLPAGRASQRRERWRRIAIEAAEQSGRTTVPEVAQLVDFEAVVDQMDQMSTVILWEGEHDIPLPAVLPAEPDDLLVVVGPEGGFTANEIVAARGMGAITASLGPLILRSETAAVAAVAGIQALTAATHYRSVRG